MKEYDALLNLLWGIPAEQFGCIFCRKETQADGILWIINIVGDFITYRTECVINSGHAYKYTIHINEFMDEVVKHLRIIEG